MCGIVGYCGKRNATSVLLDGLRALEYRGYDSAGIAYMTCDRVEVIKAAGKLKNLECKINNNVNTHIGIGHTRWATHGRPNEKNAHPHRVGKFTIVHNGIIENYDSLKKLLKGYKFKSETDSEVIAGLLDKLYSEKNDILKVLVQLKKLLIGSYALAIMCDDVKDCLFAIRKDSPLVIGRSDSGNFIASDVPAILKYTNKYYLPNTNEIVQLGKDIIFYNDKLEVINKELLTFEGTLDEALKNGYDHFMLKEINEQPSVFTKTIKPFLENGLDSLDNMPNFDEYERIAIVGCGSAYHAGLASKYLIEKYGNIETNVYIASEFRYQKLFLPSKTLVIFISQSGETADTLASLRKVTGMGIDTLAIVNVIGSSLAREAKDTIYIKAGPEISVATTKAYTAQLAILSLIALKIGYSKKIISKSMALKIAESYEKAPSLISSMIDVSYDKISKMLSLNDKCFYIGRGIDYALSLEGALKLKEISYINSLALPAGELKHGTISLIDDGTLVIAIITDKSISDKTISNIKEVKARGANAVVIMTDNIDADFDFCIKVPHVNDFINPIIAAIPLQLISYYTANLKGCDIDMPKNLAKSVTVE